MQSYEIVKIMEFSELFGLNSFDKFLDFLYFILNSRNIVNC